MLNSVRVENLSYYNSVNSFDMKSIVKFNYQLKTNQRVKFSIKNHLLNWYF